MAMPPEDSGRHTPRSGIPSFENLVILANWQENQERLRSARKMVWRDRGEPVAVIDTVEQCIEHAIRGGVRAFSLAASIRAIVNLCLALVRIGAVPRKTRLALIQHALFGQDTWRFGAMFGTFVATYKLLLNSLPIYIPALHPKNTSPFEDSEEEEDAPISITRKNKFNADARIEGLPLYNVASSSRRQREARLSLSATAHMRIIRKKTRRWHAALAGFIAGGLGVCWEKRSRRTLIGQQMFVRGLQGQYNAYSAKHNIHLPHGDILVFSLACGQIMYAWLMRPDTIPLSYSNWINAASHVPREAPPLNLALFRGTPLNLDLLDTVINRPDITPHNMTELIDLKSRILARMAGGDVPIHPHVPCAAVHPWQDSCLKVEPAKFLTVAKWMLPVYSALHFVPAILFKRQKFVKQPIEVLLKSAIGSLRSSAFLGAYVVIYHSLFCGQYQLFRKLEPLALAPRWLLDLLLSRFSFWFPGFVTGLALLIEAKHRRSELAMYVLPKALESIWRIGTGKVRGLAGVKKSGDSKGVGSVILMAVAMGLTMGTYQNDPEHLSGLVRRILYQFIGPN